MSMTIIKPGIQSSFQDLGRFGFQHLGVPTSGAMDSRAHRLANLLVGNTPDCASLEITLTGPELRFDASTCLAISGAVLSPTLNATPIPNNRPVVARAGDVLKFGARKSGLRAYLAVAGGFGVGSLMGSQSTYLRGGIGGWHGRALQKNDVIPLAAPLPEPGLTHLEDKLWQLRVYLPAILGMTQRDTIRAMRAPHAKLFTDAALNAFFKQGFRIAPQSDRMGYRLHGPVLSLKTPQQLPSEATSFGTVQVPAGGQPIILMADRQTTGGYPKLAHICTVDLSVVAQAAPGDTLHFREIDVAAAQKLDSQREEAFERLEGNLTALRDLLADYRNKL